MGNSKDLLSDVSSAKENLLNATSAISSLSNSLSSAANSFAGVVDRIEERIKEIETREASLKELEDRVKGKFSELQQRERLLDEKEKSLKQRERNIETKEEKWEEMEQRVQTKTAKLPSLVNLNVGGQRFTSPKDDLLRYKESYFVSMLTSDDPQQLDTGEFYINDDPKVFRYILNFLRTGQLEHNLECDEAILEHAFSNYRIPFPVFPFTTMFTPNSATEKNLSFSWQETITVWLPNKSFNLLYRASRDGFQAEDFHRTCDKKGPTLTIIQSNEGYIFGGYSSIAWDSSSGPLYDPNCFLFTFTNPHNILPTKYALNQIGEESQEGGDDVEAICCSSLYGATFGAGYDLVVCNNSNRVGLSYSNFPRSYVDTTFKAQITFTGECQFTTRDVEVYSVS